MGLSLFSFEMECHLDTICTREEMAELLGGGYWWYIKYTWMYKYEPGDEEYEFRQNLCQTKEQMQCYIFYRLEKVNCWLFTCK